MKETIIIIGTIVVSILLMGIPIIMTISFIYDWGTFLKYVLVMFSLGELFALSKLIGENAMDEGQKGANE